MTAVDGRIANLRPGQSVELARLGCTVTTAKRSWDGRVVKYLRSDYDLQGNLLKQVLIRSDAVPVNGTGRDHASGPTPAGSSPAARPSGVT